MQATSETLYYFSGLTSTLDADCGIIQPVLQWGPSPAGGGSFWAVASWWWGTSHQFHSPLSTVNAGDEITGFLSTPTASNWRISAVNQSGTLLSEINPATTCRFNQAFPAVFEVGTSNPIDNCNQIANGVQFSFIMMDVGFPNFNWVDYTPTNEFPIGNPGNPACGWDIETHSQSDHCTGCSWYTTTLFP
jgi:hypothetical protein